MRCSQSNVVRGCKATLVSTTSFQWNGGRSKDPQLLPLPNVQFWNELNDPKNWWISEKLDGVRALWNPQTRKLFFRKSNTIINAPIEFLDSLPQIPVEGELWTQRGSYQRISSITSNSNTSSEIWKSVSFQVFDSFAVSDKPFEERLKFLQESSRSFASNVNLIKQTQCEDRNHLKQIYNQIVREDGEGIILRKNKSKYFDRSSWFKQKVLLDAEALVTETVSSSYFRCTFFNGKEFYLHAKMDLNVGDIIVVQYLKLSDDQVPISPTFHGIRSDILWNHSDKDVQFRVFKPTKRLGNPSQCPSCKDLIDKLDYRIQKLKPMSISPNDQRVLVVNICLKRDCVERAATKLSFEKSETFDGRVYVPENILNNELSFNKTLKMKLEEEKFRIVS